MTKINLEAIKKHQPKSRTWFWLKNFLVGIFLIILTLLSVYLLSLFFIDLLAVEELTGRFIFNRIVILELIIFAVILLLVGLILYRSTEWVLVKHLGLLLILALAFSFGSALVIASNDETKDRRVFPNLPPLSQQRDFYRNSPGMKFRQAELRKKLSEEKIFKGAVTQKTETKIYVSDGDATEEFLIKPATGRRPTERKKPLPKRLIQKRAAEIEKIQVGDAVVLAFEETPEGKLIIVISKD